MKRVIVEKVSCRILLPEDLFRENANGLFAKILGDPKNRGYRYQGSTEVFCSLPKLPEFGDVSVLRFSPTEQHEELHRIYINAMPEHCTEEDVEGVLFMESTLTEAHPDGGYMDVFDTSPYLWSHTQVSLLGAGKGSLCLLAISSIDKE